MPPTADAGAPKGRRIRIGAWLTAVGEARLRPSSKAVALALASYMDYVTLECWPTISSIARRAGSARPTARRALLELLDADLIEWQGDGTGGGGKAYRRFHGLIPGKKTGRLRNRFGPEDQSSSRPVDRSSSQPVDDDETGREDTRTGRLHDVNRSSTRPRTNQELHQEPLAPAAPDAKARRAEVFEALAIAVGWGLDELTPSARGALNKAAKELDQPRMTVEEIARRAATYRRKHPTWDLTPSALVKWWAECAPTTGAGNDDTRAPLIEMASMLVVADRGEIETLVDDLLARMPSGPKPVYLRAVCRSARDRGLEVDQGAYERLTAIPEDGS